MPSEFRHNSMGTGFIIEVDQLFFPQSGSGICNPQWPVLALFYAFGYAPGNVVGIAVERKIALGMIVLRVITRTAGKQIAERLRNTRQPVTIFRGEGMRGPVDELYMAETLQFVRAFGVPDKRIQKQSHEQEKNRGKEDGRIAENFPVRISKRYFAQIEGDR
jgi:hypothetical protein